MTSLLRKYFGTDGIRGPANSHPLTPEFVVRLGAAAAATFLKRSTASEVAGTWGNPRPAVVVGKDTRASGDMLEAAIASGLASRGVDVRLAGVIPTPAVARLVREEGALFGVVVSASHNPYSDNGIKFFGSDGFKLDDAFECEIEAALEASSEAAKNEVGRIGELEGAAERYVDFVRRGAGFPARPLEGLRVALDAANGAAFRTSRAVLEGLGAEVLSCHDLPNGLNINADCGCTHPETITRAVRECGAHLGISHDGDADRVLLCDESGSVLDGDELMAIAAVGLLEEGGLAHETLVATVMSNAGLDEAVRRAGGTVLRAGVGDRYVVEAMRAGGYTFGGEQSGHFVFLEKGTTGDGIVAAVEFLRIMKRKGRPLSELRRVMEKFPQTQRKVEVREKLPLASLAVSSLEDEAQAALGEGGRVLLRYSGTENLLRILVEGRDAAGIEVWADRLAGSARAEIGAEAFAPAQRETSSEPDLQS